MQSSNQLLHSFDQAIGWNALFYGLYKFLTTILTFMLYTQLNTQTFSLYANIQSIIFILLLWLDCGFKKSIPRFCPEYAQSPSKLRSFTIRIVCFKALLLFAMTPICLYITCSLTTTLDSSLQNNLALLATAIFAVEGMVSVLQLIYQAHFWHKYFNAISSFFLLIQMIGSCTVAYYCTSSTTLLLTIFYTKIAASISICIATGILLLYLYQHKMPHTQEHRMNIEQLNHSFIQHSIMMWVSNSLKSLTERNVMVPLLTYTLGPLQANVFKVANDSALFFYRIILKTIGSTDTALLAHAKTKNIDTLEVFGHLYRKIMVLASGLLMLFFVVLISRYNYQSESIIVQIFAIITICYLIEVILSPYERILEVDQEYAQLFTAYIPYIILLILLFCTKSIPAMGLLNSIIVLHAVRIASALLVRRYAHQKVAQKGSSENRETSLLQTVSK